MTTRHPHTRGAARTGVRRLVVVAVATLAAACGGADEEAAEPTLEDAIEAEAGSEQQEAELRSDVEYGQAGGIAGRIEQLHLAPDGTGELTSRGREPVAIDLDDTQVAALAAALEAADLPAQPEEQMSEPAVPDAFTFELAYDGGHVLTDEFAAPEELKPVLELLRGIVEDARAAAGD